MMFVCFRRLAVIVALASAALLLAGCVTAGSRVEATQAPVAAPALEAIADAAHAAGFNGIAFVASRDHVLLEKAFGRLTPTSTVPLRPDSVFRFASISKQLTATLVMQEVADGRLTLDAPLGRYWPEFPNADARLATVRQLLAHTSGLPNPNKVDGFYQPTRVRDTHMRTAAETVCAAPLEGIPGEAFEYNNCDYLVLGALLEKITTTPFSTLLTQRILTRAGMTRTGLYTRETAGIEWHAQGIVDGKSDGTINPAAYAAAAGLYGTVHDVWQFNRAFTDGRLLDSAARQTMITPNQWGAALGVWSYELKAANGKLAKIVERQGWIGGIRVVNLLDLNSNTSVIVMSTQGDFDLSQSWTGKGVAAELMLQAVSDIPKDTPLP